MTVLLTSRSHRHSGRYFISALLVALFVACAATPARALDIHDVRIGLHADKTRVVFDLSGKSDFRVFLLPDPTRIVIDLPTFSWRAGNIGKPPTSGVTGLRQGPLQPDVSRVIINVNQPVAIRAAFFLPRDAAANRPDRLVIDFAKASPADVQAQKGKIFGKLNPASPAPEEKPVAKTAPVVPVAPAAPAKQAVVPPPPAPKEPPVKAAPEKQTSEKPAAAVATAKALPLHKPAAPAPAAPRAPAEKRLIVLDPGHGGLDPGAMGVNGVFEKNVTLAMARDLKKHLEATGRYRVVLTRDSDVYLRLYQRVAFARKQGAALFVSLHADSINKSDMRGASVYTLSEKASDEQTARLAESENQADLIAGVDLSQEDQDVASILVDLSMRDTMNQSKFFANTLVNALETSKIQVLEKPHRSAGFAVLKAPDIPSVLIELGFMSNGKDVGLLSEPAHRGKIAATLAEGIDAYFDKIAKNRKI